MQRPATVPLLTQLSSAFESTTRLRGADYYRNGRVRINLISDSGIVAGVRGTTRYHVALAREGRRIRASCTCPYFDIDLCKHIYAVLMAVQQQRLWPDLDDGSRVELLRGESEEEYPEGPDPGGRDHAADDGDDFDDKDIEHDDLDDDDVDEDHFERDEPFGRSSAGTQPAAVRDLPFGRAPVPRAQSGRPVADWRGQLAQLRSRAGSRPSDEEWPAKRELLYVIDVAGTLVGGGVHLEVCSRDLKKDGTWGKPKSRYLRRELLRQLPDPGDRQILAFLAGATETYDYGGYRQNLYDTGDYYGSPGYYETSIPFRYCLTDPQPQLIVPMLCRTGRCRLRLQSGDPEEQWLRVAWEEGGPWQFQLEVHRPGQDDRYEVRGALTRGAERMDLSAPSMLIEAGILFMRERAMRYEHHGAFGWIVSLRKHGALRVPVAESGDFLAELWRQPRLPPLQLPEDLRFEEVTLVPRPRLVLRLDKAVWRRDQLVGELTFDYGGTIVPHDEQSRGIPQAAERRVVLRDRSAEQAAVERLQELGARWSAPGYPDRKRKLELASARLPAAVRELIADGWHVEAEGKIYRSPGRFDIQVQSGIDWFELHGSVEFGETAAHLPELLAAVRRGEELVRLGDGTFGLLPQEWLKQYGLLAGLGTVHEDHLRFARSQVGLLDALLAAQPESRFDETFSRAREELRSFAGIEPAEPPAGFRGELRPYQQEGLGWLAFLRRFGFGGCLADDMGLGKTIQVLALLEARRELREQQRACVTKRVVPTATGKAGLSRDARIGPSLVVLPKSLVFNWRQEAARFAPRLRVLDHTGHLREEGSAHFEEYDVVLTTYGTLRNDVEDFKDVRFDYLILDEAQAIKNAGSASAKATRLLQGDHRLALSGTPIENHLGELWSLFEFLNPGMLGAASVFKLAHSGARNPDDGTRKLLGQALRPFLLRRTKQQVARELPPKHEQTLYCELEGRQRRLYDELRDHYRRMLLKRIERDGLKQAKIQILEALLRLRQAAIHPGLIDSRRGGETSAKLDMLLPRLREVLDEGHKTLVFSQFTGMLAILRERLDRDGVAYEYLDGKTRDREACVERFQTNPDCKLFLISLKAGGVGLNLTAAQYVFLLDPWWNPAVEAQAIDRAHRIGQTNHVFAYRLIARDTVEEKVLELQNTKRELADAIVGADNALIRDLGREDLELLLS